MKEHGIKMSLLTMKVLFKCFGESGSIGRIMEVYEQMFLDGMVHHNF
jgi:pentatricopeptide repeat protein